MDEFFTEEEVIALKYYLLAKFGMECEIKEIKTPIPFNSRGYRFYPVGGPYQFYMLYETQGYDLPFKVMGYYDVDAHMNVLYDFVMEILELLEPQLGDEKREPVKLMSCCVTMLSRGWRICVFPPKHKWNS